MIRKIMYVYLILFMIVSLIDFRIAFWVIIFGVIGFPIYYKYLKEKMKIVEVQFSKRNKTIWAKVIDIEIERKWGENYYCVICEYWHCGEKYIFRSIPVGFEVKLSVGQKIEVMVEESNLSNYYVMLNDYIIISETKYENVKIGKFDLVNLESKGVSKEKQRISVCVVLAAVMLLIVLNVLCLNGVFNLGQVHEISIIVIVVVAIVRKEVGW